MSIIDTKLKTEAQLRINAVTSETTPKELLKIAVQTVDLGLNYLPLEIQISARIAAISGVTSVADMIALNSAKRALAPLSKTIKSIQRGHGVAGDITIAPVNPDKSVLNLLSAVGAHRSGSGFYAPTYIYLTLKLIDSITINVSHESISWEIIEYV